MTPYEAQQMVHNKVAEICRLARDVYPLYRAFANPTYDFKLEGRSRLGWAQVSKNHMSFNMAYLMQNPEGYMSTVIHEIAHIVAGKTGLGKGHNAGWRMIDRRLGGNGQRCSSVGTGKYDYKAIPKGRQTREFLYRDSKGHETWVGPVHHNRLQARGDSPLRPYSLRRNDTGAKIEKGGYLGQARLKA